MYVRHARNTTIHLYVNENAESNGVSPMGTQAEFGTILKMDELIFALSKYM